MPNSRDPPPTDEGWYVLHDFRRIDWDTWRSAPARSRERAVNEAVNHLRATGDVEDSEEGASAVYSILGHKADLLLLHMRPSTAAIGALERRFESTDFADYTERASSFVSVTEASGYSEQARKYFTEDLDEDSGLYNYMQSRLKPTVPDATHICFYPMDKRRRPNQNWYDLPFEERAEQMDAHGDIGRDYGGKVRQMITGAIAIDDWEWGVTLWGDDLTDMKDLLYEMRFDPSTSQYAEFGPFYVGRRFPPADLSALLAGERVPTDDAGDADDVAAPVQPADMRSDKETTVAADGARDPDADEGHAEQADPDVQTHPTEGDTSPGDPASAGEEHGGEADAHLTAGDRHDGGRGASGPPDTGDEEATVVDDMPGRLSTLGLDAGTDYGDGDYAVLLYSDTDAAALSEEVEGLRSDFDHYDSHVGTVVRAEGGRSAVASVWNAERAATTAEGFLTDLPGVTEALRGPIEGGPDRTNGDATDVADTGAEEDGVDDDDGAGDGAAADASDIREELADMDVYAGQPHGEDIYALVLYSKADIGRLTEEVSDLSDGFDRYDTHEGTRVYEAREGDVAAVVSMWATQEAADTASGFLTDLPGIVGRPGEGDGFGTMGMFYTVKPAHREEFIDRFGTVGEMLEGMDGHRETALLVNHDDENDMFIASQWDSKGDAMEFFRSDAFRETVNWGRDVLADRPRHVFLA